MSSCQIFPFNHFHVLPAYGPNFARIVWTMSSPIYNNQSCTLQFQKSKDGYTNWFDLDMKDPVNPGATIGLEDGTYIDSKLGRYNQQVEWYYRAIITEKRTGKVHTTSPITYRHGLSALEFGNIREILNLEYSSPDSTPFFLCRPTTVKEDPMNLANLSEAINPLTGQVMGGMVDDIGLGKTYGNEDSIANRDIGPFSKPILVMLSIKQNKYEQKDLESGHGSVDNIQTQFSSFSYPRFKRGDLIIDPINDRRYLVDQILNVSEFKGIIPLTFEGIMTQLSRNDPMYQYQLPACAIEYALTWHERT